MIVTASRTGSFFGWRVVAAAFVLGMFGWGIGFFGPPVFLSVVHEARGWPLSLVSTAVTAHFLVGAVIAANLPALHRRFGTVAVTKAGALSTAAGLVAWATVAEPWQLFAATLLSGAGWGTMSAAALNLIVSPWFVRTRPAALGMAYNGGSVGGIVFSPLWPLAIGHLGFSGAAVAVGIVTVLTIGVLAEQLFSRTPERMGLMPDGGRVAAAVPISAPDIKPLPGPLLWRDFRFLTLVAGMTFGLFAQIGTIAHLYSLLMPALGIQRAGLAMGAVTVMAIAGRSLVGWLMLPGADRRLVACAGYAFQLAGSLVFLAAAGTSGALMLLGIALFGAGFGNATSLPPLIAQLELAKEDVSRAVALAIAVAQGTYAFAPAAFGLLREIGPQVAGAAPGMFVAAAIAQGLAIAAFLAGRRHRLERAVRLE